MPSKGSPRITLRLPQHAIDTIKAMTASRNKAMPSDREWDMTDWILAAIAEKMAKTYRGRGEKVLLIVDQPDDNSPAEVIEVREKLADVKCVYCGSADGNRCQCTPL